MLVSLPIDFRPVDLVTTMSVISTQTAAAELPNTSNLGTVD